MSVSHSKFSFPKSDRFYVKKKEYDDIFYDLPDTKTKRFAALGFGQKMSIINKNLNTPGPGSYDNKSLFRSTSEKNFGITIGFGRDRVINNKYIPEPVHQVAPNQYQLPSTLNKQSFTLSKRLSQIQKNDIPGPGQYPINSTLTANGKYTLSQIENSRCSVFNPPNSTRFKESKEQDKILPGPGQYDVNINKKLGQYVISNMQSTNPSSFSKKSRVFFDISNKNPGPGSYSLHSVFQ